MYGDITPSVLSPAKMALIQHGKSYEARLGTSKGSTHTRFFAMSDEEAVAFGRQFVEKIKKETGAKVSSLTLVEVQERPVLVTEVL